VAELRSDAASAAQRGDLGTARQHLLTALGQTVAREEEYRGATADLRDLLRKGGDFRGALTADWYAGSAESQRALIERAAPVDRARTIFAWAERATQVERGRQLYATAADAYEAAGMVARAAIARERAEDFQRARALWSRLAQLLSSGGTDLYAAGLAKFNLARTSRRTGDAAASREATVGAVHLLEEAADRYETIGQRERAFDCYQVLIAIGRESGVFEHVLEGYVNVIRILREDNLRYYALQSYEEAMQTAEKQGESAAAATLAREMSGYARKEGLPAIANFGTLSQGRLLFEVARASMARGAPPEIAENALLAAVIAYGEAGQFLKVAELYRQLSEMPLAVSRKSHYARATQRYVGASDLKIESAPLPAHLRHEVGFPEVWHEDLVEWEQHGDAGEACGDIVLDPGRWLEASRRRALVARLVALELEGHLATGATADPDVTASLAASLAEQLAQIKLYAILSPLEALYRRPEPKVRKAVMLALSACWFKRTFITLRQGLTDPEPTVVEAASRAIEELHFPHGFDPLARIYRESGSPAARASALRAIAKIDSVEAAEMILGVIEHESPADRAVVVETLKKSRRARFVDVARQEVGRMAGPARAVVEELIAGAGARL
jgi:tetratricopeptide (TPR) repeat protein